MKRNQSSPTNAAGRTRRPSGAVAVVGNGERKTIVTRLVAATAPGLVGVERADFDRVARERSGAALDQTLGPCGRAAAAVTDGLELVDEFGTGPQLGHRDERLGPEVVSRARDDHARAALGQLHSDVDDRVLEEVQLVEADHVVLLGEPRHVGGSCRRTSAL